MAINLTNTKDAAITNGIKILVHGPAGIGKTYLASTIKESVLMISAEAGLLSLGGFDIPAIEVSSIQEVMDVYSYITTGEGQAFEWVVLDSVSEIAEVCLAEQKLLVNDPRQAYGQLQEEMMSLLRKFRDLKGKNVLFSCKQDYIKDEDTGITRYSPLMPGQNLQKQIPYMFDFVFALKGEKNESGVTERFFQTQDDFSYIAKSRGGGALGMYEPADLSYIENKIKSTLTKKENTNGNA